MPISSILRTRREKEKEALKKKILNTAKKIIEKENVEAVTIRRIASEICYSLPVIYSHFKDKAEILSLVSEQILQKVNNEYEIDQTNITLSESDLEVLFLTKKIHKLAYDKSIIMDLIVKREHSELQQQNHDVQILHTATGNTDRS